MELKLCTSCGNQKPVTDFHRFGKDGARVGKWCEDCYQKKIGNKVGTKPKMGDSRQA